MIKQKEFIKQLKRKIANKQRQLIELKEEIRKELSSEYLITHSGIMFGHAKKAEQVTVLMSVIQELSEQLNVFKSIYEITE